MKYLITFILILTVSAVSFQSCKSKESTTETAQKVEIDPRFNEYVSAFTGGIVSSNSKITVQLRSPLSDEWLNKKDVSGLFQFTPSIKGRTEIQNASTVVFIPEKPLESGTLYKGALTLGKLAKVPMDLEIFEFNFTTLHQKLHFKFEAFNTPDISYPNNIEIQAYLNANDVLHESLDLSEFLTATQQGNTLKVEAKRLSDKKIGLQIKGIKRAKKSSKVTLRWKGSLIGADNGEQAFEVASHDDFSIAKVQVLNTGEQQVKIHFSDPLDDYQNLEGLIKLGRSTFRTEIDGHTITLYPSYHLAGDYTVELFNGIKNYKGQKYDGEKSFNIAFEDIKPEVKLLSEGNIMPSKEKISFPIKAVNLEAVDLIITKIYENNLTQFFQVNDIDGSYQLNRVGEEVTRQKIWLDPQGQKNLHEWNTFELPISDYVVFDKGTLYRFEIRYKKEYSAYECDESEEDILEIESSLEIEYEEPWNESGWNSYYYYDEYWAEMEYNYSERDNPCHEAYYRYKSVSTNFLSSNLGMIAKAGKDKELNIFLTNLLTTAPEANATIKIYDYQQQLLGSASTNLEGVATIRSDKKPFLVIAESNGEKSFLKLYDANSNSLSKFFDVAGMHVQEGVKGMIYTERGVWRPGDSLYVSFMLEDKEAILPSTHPVIFSFYNPKGQMVDQQVAYNGVNGLYDFRTATEQDAITGNYRATVQVGARDFTKYLKVEAIKPNRLKVNLTTLKNEKEFESGESFKLESRWLHGAIAGGLKARVEVTLSPSRTSFKEWKGFEFEDQAKYFSTENSIVYEGILNDKGEVTFDPDINVGESVSGKLNATFGVKVFEKSGNFSVDEQTFTYSPFDSYAGVKFPEKDLYGYAYKTGEEYTLDVAKVTSDGKPKSGNLEVTMYKLEWRWWWDSYSYDLASYITRSSTVAYKSRNVSLSNGKGKFSFSVNDENWGRFYIRVKDPVSGHTAGKIVYVDRPYWTSSNRRDKDGQAMLAMATDKKKYEVGENVKVTFPSPGNGRALLTIENGTRVLEKKWISLDKGETTTTVTTTEQMTPNVFVHIMLIQPHEETANDLPIRMYGVVPITVENPNTHLEPQIKMPDVWRPESKVKISVSEKSAKSMTYTLAIVDEGLLDLTNFQTPDPYSHFNAHEALGVKTWDMYDDVMDALHKNDKMLAIGGGAPGEKPKSAKANRFVPMVRFLGPFEYNGSTQTHTVDVPNYVGSVRVMVVAGEDGKYGNAEQTAFVRNPLMVLGTMPRVLAPGDELEIPADIFAMEKHVKNVTVTIETDNFIDVIGTNTKKINFENTGDKMLYFPAKIANKSGIAKVKIKAVSGKEVAYDEIEIDVRQPIGRVYQSEEHYVEKGGSITNDVTPYGIDNTYQGHIEISMLPPIDLSRRIEYLISYPHGCVEQTVSKAFPQLFLASLIDLTSEQKKETQTNIKAAVDKLLNHQTTEGGFSYWPGNPYSDEWGSNYATHFLIEAGKKGYKVPASMKKSAINFLKQKSRMWSDMNGDKQARYNDIGQAYRLYILAKAGAPEWGAMNRMREYKDLSKVAKWRLAGAYALAGKSKVAEEMIYKLETNIESYRELDYSYGSDIRDEAMILEVLVDMKQKNKGAFVARELAKKISNNKWMSTQTTAYSMIALSKFMQGKSSSTAVQFQYKIGNGSFKTGSITKGIVKIPLGNANSYEVRSKSEAVFVQEVRSGIPPFGEEPASASNLSMQITYTTTSGSPIDISSLEQGQEFIARVTIKNPGSRGYLKNMVLNQTFPSGWEIINDRMSSAPSTGTSSYYDYRDIKDANVFTYFSLGQGKQKTFEVRLIASFAGSFKYPGTKVDAMYDHTISANTSGRKVNVYNAEKSEL